MRWSVSGGKLRGNPRDGVSHDRNPHHPPFRHHRRWTLGRTPSPLPSRRPRPGGAVPAPISALLTRHAGDACALASSLHLHRAGHTRLRIVDPARCRASRHGGLRRCGDRVHGRPRHRPHRGVRLPHRRDDGGDAGRAAPRPAQLRRRQRLRVVDRTGARRHRRELPAAAAIVVGRRAPQLALGAAARAIDLLPVVPRNGGQQTGRWCAVPGPPARRAARLHALRRPLPRRLPGGLRVALRRSAASRRSPLAGDRIDDRCTRPAAPAHPPKISGGQHTDSHRSERHARSGP